MSKQMCNPCTRWKPFLAVPLDALYELPLDTQQAFAEHIAICKLCQRVQKEFEHMDQRLLQVVQEIGVVPIFALLGEDFLAGLQNPVVASHIPQGLQALWQKEVEESQQRSMSMKKGGDFFRQSCANPDKTYASVM